MWSRYVSNQFPDDSAALRRSTRQTKGEGGTAAQLERVGEAVKHVPKPKKSAVADVPETTLVNPMAPEAKKKHGPAKKGTSARVSTLPTDLSADPAAHQFLVPPGTEPSLTVPPLGFFAYGHNYGFPASITQTVNPPNGSQQARTSTLNSHHSRSDADMDIDPSLLEGSVPSTTIAAGREYSDEVESNIDSSGDAELGIKDNDEDGVKGEDEGGDEDEDDDEGEDKNESRYEDESGDEDNDEGEAYEAGDDVEDRVGGIFQDANVVDHDAGVTKGVWLNHGLQEPVDIGFELDDGNGSAPDGQSYICLWYFELTMCIF